MQSDVCSCTWIQACPRFWEANTNGRNKKTWVVQCTYKHGMSYIFMNDSIFALYFFVKRHTQDLCGTVFNTIKSQYNKVNERTLKLISYIKKKIFSDVMRSIVLFSCTCKSFFSTRRRCWTAAAWCCPYRDDGDSRFF